MPHAALALMMTTSARHAVVSWWARQSVLHRTAVVALTALTACGTERAPSRDVPATTVRDGQTLTVRDTTLRGGLEVSGVAEPVQQATLSTKLMGTVTRVLVHEGDVVRRGQLLLTLDARELSARAAQVSAAIESATAMQVEASAQAARIRALYADSAATRAQYDAATAGEARAEAGLRAARASASELAAMNSYAEVRAPIDGLITARTADPGAFAAPGAPLLTVQDASTLRISVQAASDAVQGLRRGLSVEGSIDGMPVRAVVEGVVPAGAGNLFTVNATVPNRDRAYRAGSAAALQLGGGERQVLLIPATAIIREGDLTGVTVRTPRGDALRWIRLGAPRGAAVEVSGGLRAGDVIVVPRTSPAGG